MHAKAPSRSVATTCRHSSIGMSSASVLDPVPALFTKTSTPLRPSVSSSMTFPQPVSSGRVAAPGPSASASARRASAGARGRQPVGRLDEVVDAQIRIVDAPPVRR